MGPRGATGLGGVPNSVVEYGNILAEEVGVLWRRSVGGAGSEGCRDGKRSALRQTRGAPDARRLYCVLRS